MSFVARASLLSLAVVLAGAFACKPAQARSVSAKYRAVQETPYGKAFATLRKDAPSVSKALQLTLSDAAAYFGSEPTVKSAYQDSRDGRSGGATFTIDAHGTELKGLISCTVGKKGTKVAVVVIRADAPAGEWQRLVHPESAPRRQAPKQARAQPDSEGAPAAGGVPKPANERLRQHVFEDRTASIGLAEGWTTQSREAMKGVQIDGPEGQVMYIGQMVSVQTPQSSLANMRGSLVANYSTPLEVLQQILPQLSRQSAAAGGPMTSLDRATVLATLKSTLPNGRAQLLRLGISERLRNGRTSHLQALTQMEITPIGPAAFTASWTTLRAPDSLFDRDLPLMLQMLQSMKSDDAEIGRRSEQNLAAQREWFRNQQAGVKAQQAANDAQHQQYWDQQKANAQSNRNWESGQLSQARNNDNFSEALRGYRTVEDTQTGERKSMDYLNVDKIVDELNERDPGRYQQIPLRDELHPLDGK